MFRCWDCVDPSNRFPDLPRCCAYRHRYRSRNVTTIKIMSPLTINRRTAIDNHRMSVKSTFGYRGRQRGKWTNGGDDAQKFRLPVPVAVPTLLSILHPEPRGSIGSYQLRSLPDPSSGGTCCCCLPLLGTWRQLQSIDRGWPDRGRRFSVIVGTD